MPKVILVAGSYNTGKTSSIRKFVENRRIHHHKRGDISLIFPVLKTKRRLIVGVASGGDNVSVVNKNIAFLGPRLCDVIVLASKSNGGTQRRVVQFARRLRAKLITIPTARVNGPTAIRNEIARVARQIELSIP